ILEQFSNSVNRSAVRKLRVTVLFASYLIFVFSNLCAPSLPSDLAKVSLEDLMNVQVTSVSKVWQQLSNVAAVIYVISQDIRRWGNPHAGPAAPPARPRCCANRCEHLGASQVGGLHHRYNRHAA